MDLFYISNISFTNWLEGANKFHKHIQADESGKWEHLFNMFFSEYNRGEKNCM